MIKDIKYSGYSVQPSDYECPDGQLATSLNLISEDNQLKPVLLPKPILNCNLGGMVRCIHHVPNQDNYIIVRQNDSMQGLYWIRKTDEYANEGGAEFIALYKDIKDIAIVGNTLVLATVEGLRYLLWKDGAYIALASKPPFVSISFGMKQVGECTDRKELSITFKTSQLGGLYPDLTEENSNAVFGLLLSSIKENITDKGFFYMPFFVRYAYRLYDGSYAWHSAPILMLPMVIPPLILVGKYTETSGAQSVPSTLSVPYFSLDYKILDDDTSKSLSDWKDIIVGIDVFVSAPIYTYDQSKRIERLSNLYLILTHSYYDWGWAPRLGADTPKEFFVGHYVERGSQAGFIDHTKATDGAAGIAAWDLPLNDKFHDDIKNVSKFYKVASLDFEQIKAMDEYKSLPLDFTEFDTLITRPELPDDYQSHCELSANYLLSFNSRLNLADVYLTPAQPYPLKSAVQATTPTEEEQDVSITVYTRLNGVLCSITSKLVAISNKWDLEKSFPRYIYYPDASAYKMVFKYGEKKIIINLTRHDFLNGAYWFGGLGIDAKPLTNEAEESKKTVDNVPMTNKIYTSEVNNPFYFPLLGINTVGSGRIMAISTAAKALSQGQFGQFPLYAFTDDGVWALELSSTGSYSARQPITRDVILEGTEPLQMDNAVLFATNRGIMYISGSQTTCITDVINSENPFDVMSLPGMDKLHAMLGHQADKCIPAAPFLTYISKCGMLYDYVHQHVLIYNPDYTYAYVYSLKSKEWGMMYSTIEAGVNSYPEALAVDHNGTLLDFSATGGVETKGLFVTRPIKLETPDVLKTMDTVIQRGHFQKGHVQSVLYGSRDLYNWHLVWSSRDHCLRGFRGSPYKYFRIACITSLSVAESLFGASLQFTPRQTNQPR